MTERERVKLLFGPYKTPRLKRGDRATCLLRDTDVVIIGMSNGRIPWPRCRPVGQRNGYGLLVDEELARAVRSESAVALYYWWGVTQTTVTRWRRALDVSRTNNPGTLRLVRGAVGENLKARYGPAPAPGARVGPEGPKPRPLTVWSAEELALLGVLPDIEVSQRTGRTLVSVHSRRLKLELPPVVRRIPWTAADDRVVRTRTVDEAVQRLNRSRRAVLNRRRLLGVAKKREDRRPVWSAKETALLGVLPDAEVARQTGRSLSAVYHQRQRSGLSPVVEGRTGRGQPVWTAAEDQVIRTRTVDEAVPRLNRSRNAILLRRRLLGVAKEYDSHAPWSTKETALLGVLPDAEVARRTGHPLGSVQQKRYHLGLPSVVAGPKGPRRYHWTAAEDQAIRTRTVDEAVQRLNRSRGAIEKRRQVLGVAKRR
jgi:hypothetical protein